MITARRDKNSTMLTDLKYPRSAPSGCSSALSNRIMGATVHWTAFSGLKVQPLLL